MTTAAVTGKCRSCGAIAELVDLLRVVPLDGAEPPYHVHRPTNDGRQCFASVPRRAVARIEATAAPNRTRNVP